MKIWNLTASPDGQQLDIDVYGVIGDDWYGDATDKMISDSLASYPSAKRINVHINSIGGDMFAGIAIYNRLRAHGAEVRCLVEGLAASAASIIAMAGRTIMGRGSMLMIHPPSAVASGNAEEMRRTADMLDAAEKSLIAIYKAKTGKTEEEIRALVGAETWLDAGQALAHGFADEVEDGTLLAVENKAGEVVVNTVAFKRQSLPTQILNLAKPAACIPQAPAADPEPPKAEPEPPVAEAPPVVAPPALLPTGDEPEPPPAPAPIENRATSAPPPVPTRDMIPAALVEELLAEGHARGVAAERARIQAIDELPVHGCDDLALEAKYRKPMTAAELAVAILASEKRKREELLAKRRDDGTSLAKVLPNTPANTDRATQEARAAKQIAAFANAGRGERR